MLLSTYDNSQPVRQIGNGLVSFNTTTQPVKGPVNGPLKGSVKAPAVSSFFVRKIEENLEMSIDISQLQRQKVYPPIKNECGNSFFPSPFSAENVHGCDPTSIGNDEPTEYTRKYAQDVTLGDMTHDEYKKTKP